MLRDKYKVRHPIFVEDLTPEERQELEHLIITNEVLKYEDNIYYFIGFSHLNNPPMNVMPVIARRYLDNDTGFYSGLTLLNRSGVSTQMPNLFDITTNNTEEDKEVVVGGKRLRLQKLPVEITKENIHHLQVLDLLDTIASWSAQLDAGERKALTTYIESKGLTIAGLQPYIGLYLDAKKTIKEVGLT